MLRAAIEFFYTGSCQLDVGLLSELVAPGLRPNTWEGLKPGFAYDFCEAFGLTNLTISGLLGTTSSFLFNFFSQAS